MCFICNCFRWAIDIVQRLITCALASFLCYVVCVASAVMIGAGMMFGYNYSFSEFLSLNFNDTIEKVGISYDNKALPWTFEDHRNWQLLNAPNDTTVKTTTKKATDYKNWSVTGWSVTPLYRKKWRTSQENRSPIDEEESLLKFLHPNRMTIKMENVKEEEDNVIEEEKEEKRMKFPWDPYFKMLMKNIDNGTELTTLQEGLKIRPTIVNNSTIIRKLNVQPNTEFDNTPDDADEDFEVHKRA